MAATKVVKMMLEELESYITSWSLLAWNVTSQQGKYISRSQCLSERKNPKWLNGTVKVSLQKSQDCHHEINLRLIGSYSFTQLN